MTLVILNLNLVADGSTINKSGVLTLVVSPWLSIGGSLNICWGQNMVGCYELCVIHKNNDLKGRIPPSYFYYILFPQTGPIRFVRDHDVFRCAIKLLCTIFSNKNVSFSLTFLQLIICTVENLSVGTEIYTVYWRFFYNYTWLKQLTHWTPSWNESLTAVWISDWPLVSRILDLDLGLYLDLCWIWVWVLCYGRRSVGQPVFE
jgi:hypothetical protein